MMKRKLGKLKVMSERLASYVSLINFAMILYLYVITSPLGIKPIYWLVLMGVTMPIIVIFDWKIVFPSSLEVAYGSKNREFTELREDVKDIKKRLDEMK